jgi:hypothetical protein
VSGVSRHSSGRDNDHDVLGALERSEKLIEMGADDGQSVRLLAVQAHMTLDRVLRRLGQGRQCTPTLMPGLPKHPADPDVEVVVKLTLAVWRHQAPFTG